MIVLFGKRDNNIHVLHQVQPGMPLADTYHSFTGKAQQLAVAGHLKKGQYAKLRNQVHCVDATVHAAVLACASHSTA